MATVRHEILIDADPDQVWEVIGDFAKGPSRMAPGWVVDTALPEPDVRVVSFANGVVARERLIGIEPGERRIVWSVVGDSVTPAHDNASFQVYSDGPGSRLVWLHDVLPDELAAPIGAAMEHGLTVIAQTLRR
ncbi:MAG: SRPBCC family protein [Micromonosporaceae bacterium]